MEITNQKNSSTKSILQDKKSITYLQLAELQSSVQQLSINNKKKYQEILHHKPLFQYNLYKINENQIVNKAFGKELLLRQMDKLLEQQSFLSREISLIRFRQQQSVQQKERFLESQLSPYEIMRSIWHKKTFKQENCIQHVEHLNDIVGTIRHSIKRIINHQASSHSENDSQYLKTYSIQKSAEETCNNCSALQQSNNLLRVKCQRLQSEAEILTKKYLQCHQEIIRKDEQIKRLTTVMMQKQTFLQSKISFLQEKLILESNQVKTLKEFKYELEKNMFTNMEDGYTLYIQTQYDLSAYQSRISLQLASLLEMIATNSHQIRPQNQQEILEAPKIQSQNVSLMMIPQLTFGFSQKINKQRSIKKSAQTERPATQRLKSSAFKNGIILEDIQTLSKKYIRTNQLTTKRINRTSSIINDERTSKNTIKLHDNPKNMDDLTLL